MTNNMPKENLGLLYTRRYYENFDPENENTNLSAKNDILIQNSKISPNQVFDYPSTEDFFELTTTYPGMILGIGILHAANATDEVKFGLNFDHTTGLPIIPGSTVKGVLRSMFPNREKDNIIKNEKVEYIKKKLDKEIDIYELEKDLFDNEKVTFFDAVIIKAAKAILGIDYITPHGDPSNPIKLLQNPTPIQFMRIEPGVTFRFSFLLDSFEFNKYSLVKKDLQNLFQSILKDIGIGAKTNVGYGQLQKIESSSTTTTDNCADSNSNNEQDYKKTDSPKQENKKNKKLPSQFQEMICSGELIHYKGLPLQVRLNDSKHSQKTYNIEFRQDSDRKKIDTKTKLIKVKLTLQNNKVIKVTFLPDK